MYNYYDAMYDDVKQAISENENAYKGLDRDTLEQRLNDDLFIDDSVTGNASGSYTFSTYDAAHNIADDGLQYLDYLINEFGIDAETVARHIADPEYWDVSIRCYLLPQVISDVLDEFESHGYFSHTPGFPRLTANGKHYKAVKKPILGGWDRFEWDEFNECYI